MLKIITGKTGSGKSSICLREFSEHINKSATIFTEKVDAFYFVPEQFAVTEEKRLLELVSKPLLGYEILNFKRFAYRIIAQYGGLISKDHLSASGAVMLLTKIICENKHLLQFFSDVSQSSKQIAMIMDLINEFNKYDVTPEALIDVADRDDVFSASKAKLADLSLILSLYRDEIGTAYFDDRTIYKLAIDIVEKKCIFNNTRIWLDDFTGFTNIEYKFITLMIKQANLVTVTLPTDLERDIVYEPINNTYRQLCDIAKTLNVTSTVQSLIKIENKNKKVYLNEFTDVFAEVNYCAEKIHELGTKGVNYNDIIICVRDISDYDILIKSVFNKHNIPIHIDYKKSIENNPLIKFIIASLDILINNWNSTNVIELVKTGILSINPHEFENNMIKYGLKKEQQWQHCENEDFIFIYNLISGLREKIKKADNINQVCNSLCEYIVENNCKTIIENKADEYIRGGQRENANEYYRTWNIVIEILGQVVTFLGDIKVTSVNNAVTQIRNYLQSGFAQYKIGFIPQLNSCVNVINIERLRTHNKKYLFFLGANEEFLPKKFDDTGMLKDEERRVLAENSIALADDSTISSCKEYFFIDNLINYSVDKLYLSYSLASMTGEEMHVSTAVISKLKEYNYVFNTIENCYYNLTDDADKKKMLDDDVIKVLFDPNGKSYNISNLEKYIQCPYKFFVEDGLGVNVRITADLSFSDLGNIMHDCVSHACITLDKLNICDIDDSMCRSAVDTAFDNVLKKSKYKYIFKDDKNNILVMRLREFTSGVLAYIYKNAAIGMFVPERFEYNYQPVPISIQYKDCKQIELTGRIDRCDILEINGEKYVRIVDYKSSEKTISRYDVAQGIKLQLISYLYAYIKNFPNVKPAGGIYFTFDDDIPDSDHTKVYSNKIEENSYTTKGFILDNEQVMKAGGNKKKTNNTISENDFKDMFNLLEAHIKKAMKSILDGDFVPSPTATKDVNPCKYCNAKSICAVKKSACNDM